MSRPNNSLAKIKVPGENVQRPIIPYAVGYEVEDEYNPGSYIPGDYIATLPILTEDSTIALLGHVIEEVANYTLIPNNTTGLYRYPDEVDGVEQSSHIVEVIREDHGAEEVTFTKTTETNNTQLTTSTFFNQFNSALSGLMSMSGATSIYALRYAYNGETVENGIRFGTGSAAGSMTITLQSSCILTFKWYYSYNGSTGEVVSYDASSKVIIGSNTYEFDDEDTPLEIELEAGTYTIQSYYGGDSSSRGRVILTSFEFEGEPYSIYSKKELARTEEVDAVDTKVTQHIATSNQRFADDERQINTNRTDILDINNRMGDIQTWDVIWRLPNPSEQYLKKVLRYQDQFYQCIQVGDGALKNWSFENVNGTSEITTNNVSSFYQDVGNNFNDYLSVKYEGVNNITTKFYRNNGSVKLGSSSTVGSLSLDINSDIVDNLPASSLKIGVKAYNTNGSTCQIELNAGNTDILKTFFIDNADTETLIDLTNDLSSLEDFYNFIIRSVAQHNTAEEGEEPVYVNNDKRLIITCIIAEFGTMEYEWSPVGAKIKMTDLTQLS